MQKGRFAVSTSVKPDKTMADIRKTLKKYGAVSIHIAEDDRLNKVAVEFILSERRVRFVVTMPTMAECYLRRDGGRMGDVQAKQSYEKQVRSAWRSLYLVIKGKLESIEMGIETIEEVFMAQLVLSDGKTLAEVVLPQLESGQLMLSGGTS
jgi:hypothetical protein